MKQINIQKFITAKRIAKYSSLESYKLNILESQKYYSSLSILEVSLRNAIDFYFTERYGESWTDLLDIFKYKEISKIEEAKNFLKLKQEECTKDKIVAELNFGFWTSLFSKTYEEQMRKNNLIKIFNNLPKNKQINRAYLSKKLNNIRNFRNRIFHYEKIINKPEYLNIENDINEILEFLDKEILGFSIGLNI
ncbi:hypothetical protein [Francisella tularensis]|uniref:hypothetical protein n=1 Tax=Francisella tularensis TaxID=263 RepID=UPI0008F45B90|nr:hypothetical protein [Francisella tularensis]APA82874.1 hypothetical protein N894_0890 [Francisella tularensis subsp. novicida PA10-7858]